MRREEKAITDNKIIEDLLEKGKYMTISMSKNDVPYIVTLSYGYDNSQNALYFHCANEGQKIDYIKFNPNICGTIIEDNGYSEGCTQEFRSLIVRGTIEIVDDIPEKKYAFDILLSHLEKDPNIMKEKYFKDDEAYDEPSILRLKITEITGKEEKEG